MHQVSRIDEAGAQVPDVYRGASAGFRRAAYVDHTTGSVHMGAGICFLEPGGVIQPHIHSFEESFFILEGEIQALIGEQTYLLGPGHYGLISTGVRHAFRSKSSRTARWLEMQAPQPRPAAAGRDTFFVGGDFPASVSSPDLRRSSEQQVSYFDESRLPRPGGPSEMEGFNPITGVTIKMFVDRSFGAAHQSLFLIQYQPGAKIDPHDHTFEESYFIVSGRVQATADGRTYDLGPSDAIWTGVGCIHSFENVGTEPVRWLETQAPLPPTREVFRFEKDWVQYLEPA